VISYLEKDRFSTTKSRARSPFRTSNPQRVYHKTMKSKSCKRQVLAAPSPIPSVNKSIARKSAISNQRSAISSMIPEAIRACQEIQSSDDLRLKATIPTQLCKLEELTKTLLLEEIEDEKRDQLSAQNRRLLVLGQIVEMMIEKQEKYGLSDPNFELPAAIKQLRK
jgi:hypothetical protein